MMFDPAPVSIGKAARMFTAAGYPINQSSLSRWIADRSFPVEQRGKAKLVDPNQLFDLWRNDFSRLNMSGQSTTTPPAGSSRAQSGGSAGGSSSPPAGANPSSDPKRRAAELEVERREIDLGVAKGELVPTEEVAAAAAEAIANLRAAASQELREAAERVIEVTNLPAHRLGPVKAALKAYARAIQAKFEGRMLKLAEKCGAPGGEAAEYMHRLVELALELRGLDASGAPVREKELAE